VYTLEQRTRSRHISRTHHTKSSFAGDAALGLEASITRRDFLGSALLAAGSVLLAGMTPSDLLAQGDDFTGYSGVGEYSTANGNTWDVLEAGHAIRDRLYDPLPSDIIDAGETYDCVIIGGGISGLAGALFF
jgi:spermidine dehydrogenase